MSDDGICRAASEEKCCVSREIHSGRSGILGRRVPLYKWVQSAREKFWAMPTSDQVLPTLIKHPFCRTGVQR